MPQCEYYRCVENAEFVLFGVVLCRRCRDHVIERFGGAAVRRVLTTLGQPSDAEYEALGRALNAFARATNVFPGSEATPVPLATQVKQAEAMWRDQEEALYQWERDVCQTGLNAKLRGLLFVAVSYRRIYSRYLRRRFLYDAR